MSPRFQPDLSEHRATTRIFDRGEYEVILGEPQGLLYNKTDEDTGEVTATVAGVRFPLEMAGRVLPDGTIEEEGDWGEAGEDVTPFRAYVHSDGAMRFTKRFIMAAAGYDMDDEDEFDGEWVPTHDLGIDGDPAADEDPILGQGWEDLAGNRVWVTLDKDEWEGNPQQTHSRFQPVG